ncbi:MAG TPA: DUF177 domain-containing protein [Bacteroidales bacterium]|nr:DUF177 domain-containing protein [Bacteroidales bacterium]
MQTFYSLQKVNYLDQYILDFSGLEDGTHHFEYAVGMELFREYDFREINDCNMLVHIEMNKQPDMLELKFAFSGYVLCECDRCLEEYKQPLSGNERLLVKFGDKTDEPDDNIMIVPVQEHQINLSQFIYESIVLMLPVRKVHPEDKNGKSDCNPEVIKKLKELNHQKKNNDPRWDELKKITLKN